jgi:hypothetical protein
MPKKTEPPRADTASHPEFVARLRALVDEAGGQRSFAKGVASQGTVNLWLHDSEPGRDKLAAIATATGVSLDWLIAGRGPKHFSDVPPGYIKMRLADLVESKGIATRPFFSTERFIFLPLSMLGIAETEQDRIDPMAVLLPPGSKEDYAEFVVFDFTQPGAVPPAEGSLCVVIGSDEAVKVATARSSAGATDMFGPILGPVIFRGAIVRRARPGGKQS